MDKKTKIIIIAGVAVAAGIALYVIKRKKEASNTAALNEASNSTATTMIGGGGTEPTTGTSKHGWPIKNKANMYANINTQDWTIANRCNNPLNMRASRDKWVGLEGESSYNGFCVFDTLEHGIRAAIINTRSYEKVGTKTLRAKLAKWAPASENSPTYPQEVAAAAGYSNPDIPFAWNDWNMWRKVLPAWATREGFKDSGNQLLTALNSAITNYFNN